MIRRLPVVPTLLVLIAVAVMIRLGFWQLDRLRQKDELLQLYSQNVQLSSKATLSGDPAARQKQWFRHTRVVCSEGGKSRPMAGHNTRGETGWAHWGDCLLPDGTRAEVNLGWSESPQPIHFAGAEFGGIIAPDGAIGARIVSDRPQPGLQQSAAPDPQNIPNNHLSYAVQWFLFAATALVIYALALRKRLRGG